MMGRALMPLGRRKSALATNTLLALMAGAVTLGLVLLAARQSRNQSRASSGPPPDYSKRSGWPEPVEQMRGRARGTFDIPRDMRQPQAWG